MESPSSCISTTSSSGDSFVHNVWSPVVELLFHGQISGVFVLIVDAIDLALVILLLLQGRCSRFCMTLHRGPPPMVCLLWYLEQSQAGFGILPGMANCSSGWISHYWKLDTQSRSIALNMFLPSLGSNLALRLRRRSKREATSATQLLTFVSR